MQAEFSTRTSDHKGLSQFGVLDQAPSLESQTQSTTMGQPFPPFKEIA